MKFEEIKIPIAFKQSKPNNAKLNAERMYYDEHKTISKSMLITPNGFLIDGYVKYLILKENNFTGEVPEELYTIGEDITCVVTQKENLTASISADLSYSSASLTSNVRNTIYENDGGYCYLCGDKIKIDDMTIDHVTPKSNGGENNTSNARCCCFTCNQMKGSMEFDEFIDKVKKIYRFRNLGG